MAVNGKISGELGVKISHSDSEFVNLLHLNRQWLLQNQFGTIAMVSHVIVREDNREQAQILVRILWQVVLCCSPEDPLHNVSSDGNMRLPTDLSCKPP